jgi:glutathione S-transferase
MAGTKAIPVLVDGDRIITDSDEAISYLEHSYETDPAELELHRRELSPTVYGTLPFGVKEATGRLRGALQKAGIDVLEELDLSSYTESERLYRVLIAEDSELMLLASEATPGAAALTLLEIAVYEEDGFTRVDAIEPAKGVGQIRDPEVNDRGLKLREGFINTIKALQRSNVEA